VKAAQYRKLASEHSLQVSVLEYLALNHQRDVFWFSIPNAGKRGWSAAKHLTAEGMTAGVADLCIMLPKGRVLWLELKTGKGRQSEHQYAFECICVILGHPYHLIRDLPEAIDILRRHGALKERK
jgi:hypothetical protein